MGSILGESTFTFPLGAVVQLSLLAVLQVRAGQSVGGRRGTHQLLRAAAVQAVVTTERGAHALGRRLYGPTVTAERTGGRAGPLTDGGAWYNWKVLPKKKQKKNNKNYEKGFKSQVCQIWLD